MEKTGSVEASQGTPGRGGQGGQGRQRGQGGQKRRRWPLVLGTVVATVLVILGIRWVLADSLAVFEKVGHSECVSTEAGSYCVAWVSYPDLLISSGREEIHVYSEKDQVGRFYLMVDPFEGDLGGVSIRAEGGGIAVVGESISLKWSAEKLNRLGD